MRLSSETLGRLPAGVARPGYDRAAVRPGIVHLGVGAFHKAHQAVYLDDLLARAPEWGILGASLRRPDARDALRPQDGLYTLLVRDGETTRARIVGALLDVLAAADERDRLTAALAAPATRIVSLTVTEKGYCHDPATGRLAPDNPDVRHDLDNPEAPVTAPGLILAALARRRAAGTGPFTVLCCDNLPENGVTARTVVRDLAALRDDRLAAFVEGEVAFPSTMVDRIVPAAGEDDLAEAERLTGLSDAAAVATEPFTQWVIEDRFVAGRPPLGDAGAELVPDVVPFERMKLRMLNGAHSALAYLGSLAGHTFVADAVADPAFRAFARGLMAEEAAPTVGRPMPELLAYADALLARFGNTALRHRLWQIAMDGSQKLPQRLVGTARDAIAAGRPWPRVALSIAGWMRYVGGRDEGGGAIDVRDPLADRLASLGGAGEPRARAGSLLGVKAVFGETGADPAFREPVVAAFERLVARGARQAVADVAAGGAGR